MEEKESLVGLLPLPDRRESGTRWWLVFTTVVVLASVTRLYDLQNPAWVAWDETHFGKMASWYINRTYFFDVHPALGKVMIAGAGHLTGYNGTFAFKEPGYRYNDTNYLGMRGICASMGAAIVPISFSTVYDLTGSLPAATYAALFLVLDVGLTTISRFILLDPIMMFFITAATMFNFKINKHREFSFYWWMNLLLTGLMLGCAMSVKFVGIFVVTVIGIYTITELWSIFCDINRPLLDTLKHFLARAICLIGAPAAVYFVVFSIHDQLLYKAPDPYGMAGDAWLSGGYQMRFEGNNLYNLTQPKFLAYGSFVELQTEVSTYKNYLHSHNLTYEEPKGNHTTKLSHNISQIQSVTGFRMKDGNNFWKIVPFDDQDVPDWENPYAPPEPVLNGDFVRLIHNGTGKTLAVFDEKAVEMFTQLMVGAIEEKYLKPYQKAFIIQAEDLADEAQIAPLNNSFRLYNPGFKCAIFATGDKLPDWAARQNEVTCSKRLMDADAQWTVHRHVNPRLGNVTRYWKRFIPGFLTRFKEMHVSTAVINAKMKPDAKEMLHADQPWMWPILFRGTHFSVVDEHRVYLLGTPQIWWTNLAFLIISWFLIVYIAFRETRDLAFANSTRTKSDQQQVAWRRRMGTACLWLLLAWSMHYWPFWTMGRILYFHHYFPALCYSCMLSGVVLDYLLTLVYRRLPTKTRTDVYHWTVAVIIAALFYSFYLFHPLCYGMTGTKAKDAENSTYYSLRWWNSWDF